MAMLSKGAMVWQKTQLKSSDIVTTVNRLPAYSPVSYFEAKIG